MRKVIVNSTPLIALCHVNQLTVLKQLYGEITIPKAVYDEISVKADSVCKKSVDESLDWIHVQQIQNGMLDITKCLIYYLKYLFKRPSNALP